MKSECGRKGIPFEKEYEELKTKMSRELIRFREDHEKEAVEAGYYFDEKTDSYQKFPVKCVCEILIVGIAAVDVDVVRRINIVDEKLYERAKDAIQHKNKDIAFAVALEKGNNDPDFYNSVTNTFGIPTKFADLVDSSDATISNFMTAEDYFKTCFTNYQINAEEMVGSFDFDVPGYHATFCFYKLNDNMFTKLTQKLPYYGEYNNVRLTWSAKEKYISL